jgi:3-hydroxy-9,10-secoandrosta-1,3,5(10)-triene-9,17-dione monooxygenase
MVRGRIYHALPTMQTITTEAVSREELLSRAHDLVSVLAQRAPQTEQLRRIPDETVEDLTRLGLLRIANPSKFGGIGFDYDTVLEVGSILGRGCGSTAWCFQVWSSHNWLMGHWPLQGQQDYFADGPDVLSSSSFNPAGGKAEPVEGGYMLSGHWDFSSGADAAKFALLCAFLPDQGPALMIVPRSEYQIDDTWFVSGMRGTGSKDIVIDSPVFVPRHRALSYGAMASAQTPGRAEHDSERMLYRMPAWCVMPFTLCCPLIGIAEGAITAYEERMKARVMFSGERQVNLASAQIRLAEASAQVESARLMMRHDLAQLVEWGRTEYTPSLLDRARYRRDHAYIARLCVAATNTVFEAGGGHALYDASPLQRAHRDVHAGSHQIALLWDTCAELYGRVRVGQEPNDPLL